MEVADEVVGLMAALLLVFGIIVLLVLMGVQWKECHDRNGAFVRGVIWFECIPQQEHE